MKGLKSLQQRFEKIMVAITFAELGESEEAVRILKRERKRQKRHRPRRERPLPESRRELRL